MRVNTFLFALGVDPTARDAVKVGIPTSEPHRQATPLAVETSVRPCFSLHKSRIASLTRRQANAVEFATKVCFSLFDGSKVLTSGMKGKLCNVY